MKKLRTVFVGILLATTTFSVRAVEAGSLPVAAAATFQSRYLQHSSSLPTDFLALDAGSLNNHIGKLTNRGVVAGLPLPNDLPLQATFLVHDDDSMSGYEKWHSLQSGTGNIMRWSGAEITPGDVSRAYWSYMQDADNSVLWSDLDGYMYMEGLNFADTVNAAAATVNEEIPVAKYGASPSLVPGSAITADLVTADWATGDEFPGKVAKTAYWPDDNLYVKTGINFGQWADLNAVSYMKEYLALDTGSLSDHLKKSTKGK